MFDVLLLLAIFLKDLYMSYKMVAKQAHYRRPRQNYGQFTGIIYRVSKLLFCSCSGFLTTREKKI